MELLILLVFIIGYTAIATEHSLKINKAATALVTGVLCWTIYIYFIPDKHLVETQLTSHIGDIAGILFFLMGAMTVVELIDAHDGFEVITSKIKTRGKRPLLWIVSILTFFLSAVFDNLTTCIVMVTLLRKLLEDRNDRMLFLGMVIIAANAGGAWSPVGDVTTTMLWIGGQITAWNIIVKLFIPSLVCLLIPLLFFSIKMKGDYKRPQAAAGGNSDKTIRIEKNFILLAGIGVLVFVPIFKGITHLPPYMGILLGLGILWIVTEIIHKSKNEEDKSVLSVVHALRKIDVPSILFFLGILISISALQTTGQLGQLATYLNELLGNENLIAISIGLLSAIVDNVPLVAGAIGMYDLSVYPPDHSFWTFIAYTAGTGGSALIIGSAAGVAVMGMENIDFMWYLKKISLFALLGYFAGSLTYIALST